MKNDMTPFSQKLRREMTKEERHLWYDFLKQLTVTVKRQEIIDYYIVDFYIPQSKIAIEIDGSQHYSKAGIEKDRIRDRCLYKHGITVLRYTNKEIHQNFREVCADILKYIEKRKQ